MAFEGIPRRGICEHWRQVDIRRLAREGMLDPKGYLYKKRVPKFKSTDPNAIAVKCDYHTVTLFYNRRDEETSQRVNVTRTFCNYGKDRPWFLCPSCGRRCAILYLGGSFACRECWRLKYQTQRSRGRAWTNYERIRRIRRRLGASPESAVWQPVPPRPKYMRKARYERLAREYEAAQCLQTRIDTPLRQRWR